MARMNDVRELRLVVTVDDYATALAFYRDVLGLSELAAYEAPNGGRITLLEAGRATIELADAAQANYIDDIEVGRRVAGTIRVAFEVSDAERATGRLVAAGAEIIAAPIRTPWNSLNARLVAPDGLQLTLFQELEQLPLTADRSFDDHPAGRACLPDRGSSSDLCSPETVAIPRHRGGG
jgi:lactoylglutathione lyase